MILDTSRRECWRFCNSYRRKRNNYFETHTTKVRSSSLYRAVTSQHPTVGKLTAVTMNGWFRIDPTMVSTVSSQRRSRGIEPSAGDPQLWLWFGVPVQALSPIKQLLSECRVTRRRANQSPCWVFWKRCPQPVRTKPEPACRCFCRIWRRRNKKAGLIWLCHPTGVRHIVLRCGSYSMIKRSLR